ncbi:sodium-dependent transporter [Pseudoteredinibacter isoporae]|uniref:sodium-dependent transporter n=1 Tax=Pseudoteredinibacter isoporae TaxID=570281 RepID=UPI003109BE5C
MSSPRGQFSSKTGFIMAAAGSAVGLGNIWGFPTQTASNGGAAFVLAYLVLAFCLAYPALMAELTLGRHSRSNTVDGLASVASSPITKFFGRFTGWYGIVVASLILSFYTIIAGWMVAYLIAPAAEMLSLDAAQQWLTEQSNSRNLIFGGLFAGLTMAIIASGVESGIERWSTRLMPALIILLLLLIIYVLSQDGAAEGLKLYLLPDLSQLSNPDLIVSAMGQAFFSLSLGVGTMMIYGSYLSKDDSLPRLGAIVTTVDVGIAFTAGLLIIPAMFVAQHHGATIYGENGELLAGPDLIFQVLPVLFDSMGAAGPWVAIAFFGLMTIASLTSSISMLEVPVARAVETSQASRPIVTMIIGGIIFAISAVIILNFGSLFGLVVDFTTKYSQPILGILLCIFAGWIMHRDRLLAELKEGHEDIEDSLFWKIWPVYVRFFCPALIVLSFYKSL